MNRNTVSRATIALLFVASALLGLSTGALTVLVMIAMVAVFP